MAMYKKVSVKSMSAEGNQVFRTGFDILKRQIELRSSAQVSDISGDVEIILGIREGIGKEGFSIVRNSTGQILITGNDELGLLYGIGKFLRNSVFGQYGLKPAEWSGTSIPVKEIRGIYFATHFHNYYHDAPIKEVEGYLEELILWGVNTLCVWFDMHHYKSLNEPDAAAMISRLKNMLLFAKNMSLKTCLLMIGNEAFAESPAELRAQFTAGHDEYILQLAGHYHIELCPSKTEGLDMLLQWRRKVLQCFFELKPDYICIWPYDQGGCTCSDCKPWGSNGYLKAAQSVAELARYMFPDVKTVFSTWLFDNFTTGEWVGLSREFKNRPVWVDYLLAEFLDGRLPEVVAENGFPGGLPCIGFPEISMYGATPWGGFGANPVPNHIQSLWNAAEKYSSGGFPYSEGIFDDLNKVIYMQLYWGETGNVQDIVDEYLKYEFGSLFVDEMVQAVNILEKTIIRNRLDEEGRNHNYPDSKIPWKGEQSFPIEDTNGINEAFSILSRIDGKLPARVRKSWRWRILYLRGLIDCELLHNGFKTNENIENAYKELTKIYHAQNADYCVAPPTLESINSNRGGFSWT